MSNEKKKTTIRSKVKSHKKEFARKLRNNTTKSEKVLWKEIRNKKLGVKFRRQVVILEWIADFYCPSKKLVVELDGKYHHRLGQPEIDKYRDQKFIDSGFRVLRIDSSRVFTDMTTVIAQITSSLNGFIIE